MANSNTIYLSGKGFWLHRLFELDDFRGSKHWSMRLYPDPKSFEEFKRMGLQQKRKKDEDGEFVTFRRNLLKPWKLKPGESPEFDPPKVTDEFGGPWDEDKLVGNGSEVTVKLEVYQTANGPGARIEGVRIDKWVEYIPPQEGPNDTDSSEGKPSIRPF